MINPYDPPKNFSSIQIVDSKDSASLVLVREERESLGFTGTLVANEIHIDYLAVLREDGEEVALGEVKGDAAGEDVGGVLELGVPRRILADAQERFLLVDNLRPLHLRKGIHRRRRRRRREIGPPEQRIVNLFYSDTDVDHGVAEVAAEAGSRRCG